MKFSASRAAKEVGVSITTIVRNCKSGKLSHEVVDGGYLIEASELFRVFPPVAAKDDSNSMALGSETPSATDALQVEIRLLREQNTDLRQDRDHWREQAGRLLLSATNPGREPERARATDAALADPPGQRPRGRIARLLFRQPPSA